MTTGKRLESIQDLAPLNLELDTAQAPDADILQLHSLAAKKFAKQIRSTPRWHQQKELKDRIAAFLNAKIERSALGAVYKRGITGKWVARSENWNGIETALKGGQ